MSSRTPCATLALGLLCSCTSAFETARLSAADRAAREFGCDPSHMVVTPRPDLSRRTFDVQACGHAARYSCSTGRYTDFWNGARVDCVREPLEAPPPPALTPAPTPTP